MSQVRQAKALWPQTLSSGPESGPANQIFALVGYVLMAESAKAPLVLPTWASHYANGSNVPFGETYDTLAFTAALSSVGVDTLAPPVVRAWRPRAIAGWEAYKAFSRDRVRLGGWHPKQSLEDAVLRALRPSSSLERRVTEAARELRLGGSYGCVHARIEEDMRASWSVVHAGRPPSLEQYLSGIAAAPQARRPGNGAVWQSHVGEPLGRCNPRLMCAFPLSQLLRERSIFVAVGLAISDEDATTIDRVPTRWGARLVRTLRQKAWHRGQRNASEASYLAASATDYELCRRASWLVGWCGSSFTRALARARQLDHGEGWCAASDHDCDSAHSCSCACLLAAPSHIHRFSACADGVRYVPPASETVFTRWAMCAHNGTTYVTWVKTPSGQWASGRQTVIKNCSFGLCDKTEYVRLRDDRRRRQWEAEQRHRGGRLPER